MTGTLFDKTLDARFAEFDEKHPEIYAEFRRIALAILNAGGTHASSDGILHTVRCNDQIRRGDDCEWKVNNSYTSRFSRKLAAEDPRFASFFEFRVLKAS